MDIGMLWQDHDPRTSTAQKIQRAIDYYRQKYGEQPNMVMVNPGAYLADIEVQGVQVKPYRPVLPGHLWIGVEQAARSLEQRSCELVVEAEHMQLELSL